MATDRMVVLGTSAGGVDALRELAQDLPAGFPAPICIVLHIAPQSPGLLPEILSRVARLPVVHAHDRQRIEAGTIYVAPPDRHLIVEPGCLRVTREPQENRFRPAIDPLFRSAAQVYGPATIGVILTGNLEDGTEGLRAVKQLGGIAIVQDEEDALFPDLPAHAARHVPVDYRVPLKELAGLLGRLVSCRADQNGERTPAL